jgi:hypothetical protein
MRLAAGILGLLLFLSGTVSLTRQVSLGGVSLLALLSLAALPVVVLIGVAGSGLRLGLLRLPPLAMLSALVLWSSVSLFWYPANVPGLQNIVVVLLWLGTIMATTRVVVARPRAAWSMMRWLERAGWLACGLYAVSVVAYGPESAELIAPRLFGLFVTLVMAWSLARSRFLDSSQIVFFGVGLVLIVLSLGRMSLAVALALILVSRIGTGIRAAGRTIVAATVAGAITFLIVDYDPLVERQLTGDVVDVAGVPVNVRGRDFMWAVTWESGMDRPIVGKGVGSAEENIDRLSTLVSQPHNEFLRIWHDHGVIGLSMLVLFLGMVFTTALRGLSSAERPEDRAYHLAAIGMLLSLVAHSITGNPLQYFPIVVPTGVIFGISIALEHRRVSDSRARRESAHLGP